ncbi:MAG: cobyrinate a,c-diamide synthase [Clostridium sp.]
MKSLVIASNCSGGGKTTFTLGLMKALKNRGYDVQGYKVGPDYIDTGFHSEVIGKASRNLDLHLMGEDGVKASFSRGTGDLGVIEGVMGLYDGKGITEEGSTYEVSKVLDNTPIILVLTPRAQTVTLCAEINGLKDFKNANIVGVVLNSVSEKFYSLLKYAIELNCNVKVFGYMPKNEKIALESRHLGLIQSVEIENLLEKIEVCANLIEEHVDLESIIDSFKEVPKYKDNFHLQNRNLKIAVAYDKAFRFYYKENLELLEEIGEVIYFSPINDKSLPKNIDFLYLGGGYPEVFKNELEANVSMRESIKESLDSGLKCYAECGGLMYLTESISGSNMVGFLKGYSEMTKGLIRFGYATISVENEAFIEYKENNETEINYEVKDNDGNFVDDKNNSIKKSQMKVNCHEFHKSDVKLNENTSYIVEKKDWSGENLRWTCGYKKKNTLAGYPHIHFIGNLDFLKSLVNYDE